MSDVFISYARETETHAKKVAVALRAAGFGVWYDEDLPAHRAFSEVIEERLRDATAVVVIWSTEAAKSEWVRAEADTARKARKLVQLKIDKTELPLPFNQIQCVDLAGWAGNFDASGWQRIVASVEELAGYPRHSVATAESGGGKSNEPKKLAICVLPFANMSGDAEQEYFSDGISEDIITDLTKVSALSVIARNSAFAFKGKNVDVRHVAQQLNVSHVLEGSVRKVGARVRITAQLIDGARNDHIWAERYDRNLNDIFALQDEISEAIVRALKLKLLPEEKRAIERRGTSSLEAYNLYLKARQLYLAGQITSLPGSDAIIRLCKGAIKIDEKYALAWSLMALTQAVRTADLAVDRGLAAAERALTLDASLAEAHVAKGRVLRNMNRYDEAAKEYDIALSLDPESPEANMNAGYLHCAPGSYEKAIGLLEKAAALSNSPNPTILLMHAYRGIEDKAGEQSAARRLLERAETMLSQEPDNTNAMGFIAVALSALGEAARAREIINRGLLLEPDNLTTKINFARARALLNDVEAATNMIQDMKTTASTLRIGTVSMIGENTALAEYPPFKALVSDMKSRGSGRGSKL